MTNRGWPPSDATCTPDVFGVPQRLANFFNVRNLHEITRDRGNAINDFAMDIARPSERNWTYAERKAPWLVTTAYVK